MTSERFKIVLQSEITGAHSTFDFRVDLYTSVLATIGTCAV